MKSETRTLLLRGAACSLLGLMASAAVAQDAAAVDAAGQPVASVDNSEIVVTARRVAENIQSVPVSITAFSPESLKQRSIKTTEDLQLATPGVFLSGVGGRQNVNYAIRGQSKAVSGLSSPGVVSYFADVPDPVQGSASPQYDVSSIQVLKGPQGTLFGRNTTGGAVLFYPATPEHAFKGYVEATYGTFNNRQFQGMINAPIIQDKVAIRIAGDYQKRDGYTKQLGAGKDLDNINSRAIRVSLLIEPFEGFKSTTIYDFYRNYDNGQSTILTKIAPPPGTLDFLGLRTAVTAQLAAQQARGPFVINNSVPQYQRVKRSAIINRSELEIGAMTLVNIFGYRSTSWNYLVDADGMPFVTSDGTGVFPAGLRFEYLLAGASNNTHQISDELQLEGRAFDDKLEWLVGAFYLKSKPSGPSASIAQALLRVGAAVPPSNYGFLTETSKALFAHIGYNLDSVAEGLKFNAGFRYSWDKFSACTGSGVAGVLTDVEPGECVAGNPLITKVSTNRTSSSAPTWTVGLDWQVTPDLFTYIAQRRGYRSGGINGPTFAGRLVPFQTFGPETVTDVEIGVRSDWHLGGETKLRVNVSAYSGWYNKVQSALTGLRTQPTCNPAIVNPPGISPDGDCDVANDPAALTLLANIGKSKVSGIDVDGGLFLSRNFAINYGASYIDTKTRSISAPAALLPYIPGGGIPFRNTPKYTFLAGAAYSNTLPDDLGDILLRADYYHNAKVDYTGDNIPAYDVVNARAEWNNIMSTGFDLAFFVRNLFDKEYIASTNLSTSSIFILTATYGVPRTYGITGRINF